MKDTGLSRLLNKPSDGFLLWWARVLIIGHLAILIGCTMKILDNGIWGPGGGTAAPLSREAAESSPATESPPPAGDAPPWYQTLSWPELGAGLGLVATSILGAGVARELDPRRKRYARNDK